MFEDTWGMTAEMEGVSFGSTIETWHKRHKWICSYWGPTGGFHSWQCHLQHVCKVVDLWIRLKTPSGASRHSSPCTSRQRLMKHWARLLWSTSLLQLASGRDIFPQADANNRTGAISSIALLFSLRIRDIYGAECLPFSSPTRCAEQSTAK